MDVTFAVTLEYVGSPGTAGKSTIAVGAVTDRFQADGNEQHVEQILTTDVQTALLTIETPGKMRISGDEVAYHVPFTRLSGTELDTIADAIVDIADRVEQVGRVS